MVILKTKDLKKIYGSGENVKFTLWTVYPFPLKRANLWQSSVHPEAENPPCSI